MVLQYHQPMLEHLLPALCEVISQPSEGGDARFFCLRMVSEVTQVSAVCWIGPQADGLTQQDTSISNDFMCR